MDFAPALLAGCFCFAARLAFFTSRRSKNATAMLQFLSTDLLLQGESQITTAQAYRPFAPSAATITPLVGVFVASKVSRSSVCTLSMTFCFIQLFTVY